MREGKRQRGKIRENNEREERKKNVRRKDSKGYSMYRNKEI
jgi:hypothetical protein